MEALARRKIMVIGASSGSGRATAIALARHGADVAFMARRKDELAAAIADAGSGHAVTVDVADPADIHRAVAEAVAVLGGTVDAVVYSAGMSPLKTIETTSAEEWARVFAVNTIGPNLVIAAALPHLSPTAVVVAFSSDAAADPRHSLVPYAASKRALEATMEGWRTESEGGHRFVTVVLGPTGPSGFADTFDPATFEAVRPHWAKQGMKGGLLEADHVAATFASQLDVFFAHPGHGIETLTIRAPAPLTDHTG